MGWDSSVKAWDSWRIAHSRFLCFALCISYQKKQDRQDSDLSTRLVAVNDALERIRAGQGPRVATTGFIAAGSVNVSHANCASPGPHWG